MNNADIEFYHAAIVMTLAKFLAPKNRKWDSLSYRTKQKYLNKAVEIVKIFVVDTKSVSGI